MNAPHTPRHFPVYFTILLAVAILWLAVRQCQSADAACPPYVNHQTAETMCDFWGISSYLTLDAVMQVRTENDSIADQKHVVSTFVGPGVLLHASYDGLLHDGDTLYLWGEYGTACVPYATTQPLVYQHFGSQEFWICPPGDFTHDGVVNQFDLAQIVGVVFRGETRPNVYDVSGDCTIDATDVGLVVGVAFANAPNTMTRGCW